MMALRLMRAIGITFLFTGVVLAAAPSRTAFTVSPSSATIEKGKTVQLYAKDASGKVLSVQWSSSSTGIATVNGNGLVTGVAAGQAKITGKIGPTRAWAIVTVTAPAPAPTPEPTPTPTPDPTPTPTEPTPTAPDPSWIVITPGESIQSLVNLYPTGTTFYLKAGIHYKQRVVPKSGDKFIGEAGAVMDGQKVTLYAFETLTSAPTGVTIKGLEIRNYVPPVKGQSVIQGDNSINWVISDNYIHDNGTSGVRPGRGAQVLRNRIYRNARIGIDGYRIDGALIQDNEIWGNNPSNARTSGEGGMKLMGSKGLTVRHNNVHDNYGVGIWSDTNYPTVLIENNTVTNNSMAGIWHEVSYDAIIRYNTVTGNGTPSVAVTGWIDRAGIQTSNSPNVQIYGNTVTNNANGITAMHGNGYPLTGPYGAYIVQNLSVHDNVVRMPTGRAGMDSMNGDTTIYTSRNNHFEHNTYYLGTSSTPFVWNEFVVSVAQWQSYGNDETGTIYK